MEIVNFRLSVIFTGLVVMNIHCVIAIEVVDYKIVTQGDEKDIGADLYDTMSDHDLDDFDKRTLDSIADSRGFSGFSSKRLYGIPGSMTQRSFDPINYGSFSGFVKRRLANDRRLHWYVQKPINLVGGMGPIGYEEKPVNAIYVGGLNKFPSMARETRYIGSPRQWYNIMSNIRLSRFPKRSDEVVDDDLPEFQP